MKKTKIICSIGPASVDVDVMEKLVLAGMNVARINFSHATLEEREAVVKSVKEVRKKTSMPIGILYDTKGPEFRSGMVQDGGINLVEGKEIKIVKEDVIGSEKSFSVNYPKAIDDLKVGNIVLLENGLMKLEVIEKEKDFVNCKIVEGGVLGSKKSLNVPFVQLDIPFISDTDKEDIIYACGHEADFLALSFVNTKEDILKVREILKEQKREDLKIIAKIESTTGVNNIIDIIKESDGIMVARGDLGVEAKMEDLPIIQKKIIDMCRSYEKISIVATEMLASMYTSARPTRAEVTDIANAVLDGCDAVMLSGETTVGKHPVEAVSYMASIASNAENYFDYDKNVTEERSNNVTRTIAKSVIDASNILDSKLIVAASISGYTARKISALKPKCPVLATVTTSKVANMLTLNYGVYSVVVPVYNSTDELIVSAKEEALKFCSLEEGDTFVITGGFPNNRKYKSTNFMKIEEI